jgi:hypothetical protein
VELTSGNKKEEKKIGEGRFFFSFFRAHVESFYKRAHEKREKKEFFSLFFCFRKSPTATRSTWSATHVLATIFVHFCINFCAFLQFFSRFLQFFAFFQQEKSDYKHKDFRAIWPNLT